MSADFELDGILEPIAEEHPEAVDTLECDYDAFRNYGGVEDDPEALAILEGYVQQGWLSEFASLAELETYVQGRPILSKFACISKERPDGSIKRRIIMDSKASGVTAASRKQYRAVLPRQTDLMQGTLHLQSLAKPAEAVWYLVQDAVDAYWQVRLQPQERKYYCAMLRRPGKKPTFLAYNRTPQGSRGAPLSWTILYGLICRLAFSTLRCPVTPDSQRMEVYVDDPVCLLLGTEPECKQQAAIMTLA